ncbi:MAG TPA: hypothetical protein VN642_06390 [Dongiaceae bacterium]|nr:hypothetical protein [Dongiaceae bacterium]
MPLHSIVRFDSDIVQVVTFRHGGMAAERTTTIPAGDFEAFLSNDRSDDYQIIVDAPEAQYEIITIPPVEPKLVSRIAEIEFLRLYPGNPPFTAFYRPIDEVAHEGRTLKRVACCMVPNDYLDSVLEPFVRFNKSVSLITTLPAALAHMVNLDPETNSQSLLCAYDSSDRKCIFLLEKGCVTMARYVPSAGAGWSELDYHNITMTLDYCFQTLRVRPSRTIAMNGGAVEPPLTLFSPENVMPAYHELQQEYLAHLAVMACMGKTKEDLRPDSYLTALTHQKFLRKVFLAFLAGSLVTALLAVYSLFSILSLQNQIEIAHQREHTIAELLSAYHAVQQEKSTIEPIVTAMNTLQSSPTIPELLGRLPERLPGSARINSIMAGKSGDAISLRLSGTITEKTLAAAQNSFEAVLECFAQLQSISTGSRQFDQKTQAFTIELRSKP